MKWPLKMWWCALGVHGIREGNHGRSWGQNQCTTVGVVVDWVNRVSTASCVYILCHWTWKFLSVKRWSIFPLLAFELDHIIYVVQWKIGGCDMKKALNSNCMTGLTLQKFYQYRKDMFRLACYSSVRMRNSWS